MMFKSVPHITSSLMALCLSVALTGCGATDKADSESADGSLNTAVAAQPFSIGNSTANEMGEEPRGDMSLAKNFDPYSEMMKSSANSNDNKAPE